MNIKTKYGIPSLRWNIIQPQKMNDPCYNMDEHITAWTTDNAKSKNPNTKAHILYDSIYMKRSKIDKSKIKQINGCQGLKQRAMWNNC